MKPIAVVGSLNLDYICSVDRLPRPGETVRAVDVIRRFGGKGANQALAAASQGASVRMVGCVGNDSEGHAYVKRLQSERISTLGITMTSDVSTGSAFIAVDRSGENTIVVAAGANGKLSPGLVRKHAPAIRSASFLLMQFEVPLPAVIAAARIAQEAGVPIIMNPSPLVTEFPWGRYRLDTLIVNEVEARSLFGTSLKRASVRQRLIAWNIEQLVITRGARSTKAINALAEEDVPVLRVQPLDTVGAGDAFAGTYVARRAEGHDIITSVRYANCAGALATLKAGAQEALPTRPATNRAFAQLKAKAGRSPAQTKFAGLANASPLATVDRAP